MDMLAENIRMALASLRGNITRTLLTMLGIVIGVASVVILLSLGQFVQTGIRRQFQALRVDQLVVFVFEDEAGCFRPLTMRDIGTITAQLGPPTAFRIMPQFDSETTIVQGSRALNANISGVTTDYLALNNRTVTQGRFFTDDELAANARVAVLSPDAARRLFGQALPLGQTVRVETTAYEVIGVLNRPAGDVSLEGSNTIIMPLTTAQTRLSGEQAAPDQRQVTSVTFQPTSPDADMAALSARLNDIMRDLRRIQPGALDDFFVLYLGGIIDTFTSVIGVFTAFLGVTAGISLLVGGIGVMNIMLVTVTERTREIGLRKAVGAQSRDIIAQFLLEAVVITLTGGGIGVAFALLIAAVAGAVAPFALTVEWSSIALALGISTAIGLFFGIYPARRAARLNPIQALRFE